EDVLRSLAQRRRADQILVGFAAEDGDGAVDRGQAKLERKHLDAVVVNDISQPGIGFDSADNEVTVVLAGGRQRHVGKTGKEHVADVVLDEVESLLAEKENNDRAIRANPDRATRV